MIKHPMPFFAVWLPNGQPTFSRRQCGGGLRALIAKWRWGRANEGSRIAE